MTKRPNLLLIKLVDTYQEFKIISQVKFLHNHNCINEQINKMKQASLTAGLYLKSDYSATASVSGAFSTNSTRANGALSPLRKPYFKMRR